MRCPLPQCVPPEPLQPPARHRCLRQHPAGRRACHCHADTLTRLLCCCCVFCHWVQVMEYAVTHYDAAFVLKTDDDAFINVVPMVDQLKLLCENPGCQR